MPFISPQEAWLGHQCHFSATLSAVSAYAKLSSTHITLLCGSSFIEHSQFIKLTNFNAYTIYLSLLSCLNEEIDLESFKGSLSGHLASKYS